MNDDVALRGRGDRPRREQVGAGHGRVVAGRPERHLLADDRRQRRVEGEHELLDVARALPSTDRLNTRALRKRKSVSTLPSWRKPKPRIWSPMGVVAGPDDRHRRHPEHADLLVQVP